MSFGLIPIDRVPTREVRTQSITHVDPFIKEGFHAVLAVGQLSKLLGWSRSFYTLEGHMQSILGFQKPIFAEPSDASWIQLKQESFDYFRNIPKVTSLSAERKDHDFNKVRYHESTSAGYGYTSNPGTNPTHKGPPDGPQHTRAKRIASRIVHECTARHNSGVFDDFIESIPADSNPDIAFTRTQLAELPDMKIRNVFGECFHYVLLEGLFAQPLIEMFMQNDFFYFIGRDPVRGVPDLINSIPDRDQYYLSLDWSSFDASVQPYEIDLAFDLLESILNFPNPATHLIFRYVRRLFMKRKVASPDGTVYMRYGGVPSGSFFTHIVDSIINWNRIRYLFIKFHVRYGVLKTHGDDAFVELQRFDEDCLNDMVTYSHTIGWYIKREKSQLYKDRTRIIFLGRSTLHGMNTRNAEKCFRLMYYPEYPVYDPQISIARLKAIDIDSGFAIPEIPQVYLYLKNKYGDHDTPLPREFQVFRPLETTNISI
jgi:hypothetical protein